MLLPGVATGLSAENWRIFKPEIQDLVITFLNEVKISDYRQK